MSIQFRSLVRGACLGVALSMALTVQAARTPKPQATPAQADYDASVAALQPNPVRADTDATALLTANTTPLGAQLANLNAQAALNDAQVKGAAKTGPSR